MSKRTLKRTQLIGSVAFIIAIVLSIIPFGGIAHAAGLTQAEVRLDRLKASTATGGTVCAKTTTVGVETTVKVDFPTGFTVNGTASNWTVTTTNLPTGSTPWIGIGTASLVASQAVTFPSGDMVVGTLYCFNFSGTTTLTTGTAGNDKVGVVTAQLAGPTTNDSSSYSLSIISDDQIVVSAVVPPTFSFALNGNTDAFTANLSTTTVSTTGKTATITTNAANGWVTWVKSANAALSSASTSATIATAGSIDAAPTDLAGTTGYVLDTDLTTDSGTGTGTVTVDAEYNGSNTTSGGTLSTNFQPIASCNGTTAGDVLTITERAKITAVQKAANDYTDTLTVVSAGLF
jgi:hypothetical protein